MASQTAADYLHRAPERGCGGKAVEADGVGYMSHFYSILKFPEALCPYMVRQQISKTKVNNL